MKLLDQWLKEGKITQAEYDAAVAEMNINAQTTKKDDVPTPKSDTDNKLAEILASLTDKEPKHNMLLMAEMSKKFEADNKKHEAEIKALKDELGSKLDTALNIIGEQKLRSDAAEKVMNEKLESERKAKIALALEDAKKAGKIPPENKEQEEKWQEVLNSNYETGMVLLNAVPSKINDNNSGKIAGTTMNQVTRFENGLDPRILEAVKKQPEYSSI